MSTVLVVDDKEMMRDSVAQTLRRAGFEVAVAADGPTALGMIAQKRPDAIVTDLKMPGMSGIELVEKIAQIDDTLPSIVMTAFGTIETAVEAMKRGAFDYVTKPFEGDELIITIKRGLRQSKLARENAVLRAGAARAEASVPSGGGLDRLVGVSPQMDDVKAQIEAVAASQGNVLITGESGTGKEVVARAVHDLSPRSGGAFLAVNCAALSESLLESELFGHERGAFTGADKLRKGRFELADGGTLLLDEVSEVSPHIQAKLLRVLQERAFERVGSSLTIGVDVRVVATSNRDLTASIEAGDFRGDLFYRLNVLPVHLPPLRARRGDVGPLAEHFIGRFCAREGREALGWTDAAMDSLERYAWPGNVRELQNICERAVVLATARGASRIDAPLIDPWLRSEPGRLDAALAEVKPAPVNGAVYTNGHGSIRPLADIERETIVTTLHHFNGHRQKTARALGIGVRTLGLKLKKWKEEQLVPATL
ncbi:MAG: sigma-54-dependent Fis family transcriptional regulator [Phycisphaeraceae bacterium]|nr:MAG: sigma-54-dependent Fis family transcriptional regulator [Phycisphaeraceae bacterium]